MFTKQEVFILSQIKYFHLHVPITAVIEKVVWHAVVDLALQRVGGAVQLGLVGGWPRHHEGGQVGHTALMLASDQALMGGYQVNRAEILRRKL